MGFRFPGSPGSGRCFFLGFAWFSGLVVVLFFAVRPYLTHFSQIWPVWSVLLVLLTERGSPDTNRLIFGNLLMPLLGLNTQTFFEHATCRDFLFLYRGEVCTEVCFNIGNQPKKSLISEGFPWFPT